MAKARQSARKHNPGPVGRAAVPSRGKQRTPTAVAAHPAGVPPAPQWLQLSTLALALIGFGLSVYLTITHLHPAALVCSDKGLVNCSAVTTSAQSKVFGIFPVAELGLAFYIFMVAINTPWCWRAQHLPRLGPVRIGNREIRWIRLGSIIVGIGFVLYLVYAELILIGNICLFCTGVHIVTFFLFVLIIIDSVFRQAPAGSAARTLAPPANATRAKG
ncbi:MAG: vitamin K epoxide reductase family protein [Streptosporangiaceae bacterium]